jgi:hypothetical protein
MRRLVFLVAVISLQSLEAQSPRLGIDRAALAGVILDSASGKAPRKTEICPIMRTGETWVAGPCAEPDSLGRYRLDNLLLTTIQVSVGCETLRGGKNLARETLLVSEAKEIKRDWIVSTVGCDLRPMRRFTKIVTGFWTPGFEASEFIPCPVDSWFLPSDSLPPNYNSQRAWARLGKGARVQKWPDAPRDRWGNPQFYVEWSGTLEGPGHYGHFGMSAFSFVADSIIQIRAPRRGDCGLDSR